MRGRYSGVQRRIGRMRDYLLEAEESIVQEEDRMTTRSRCGRGRDPDGAQRGRK